MLGAPDPASMSCDEIIKGYEKNLLLGSPEGGRSKNHQKQHRKRAKKLEPFYNDCVTGVASKTAQQQQLEVQQAVDMVYDQYGQQPMSMAYQRPVSAPMPSTWIVLTLGVGAALAVVYFMTKRRS
jgi:hypothetical protein